MSARVSVEYARRGLIGRTNLTRNEQKKQEGPFVMAQQPDSTS
jgi:hypothetical protein